MSYVSSEDKFDRVAVVWGPQSRYCLFWDAQGGLSGYVFDYRKHYRERFFVRTLKNPTTATAPFGPKNQASILVVWSLRTYGYRWHAWKGMADAARQAR